MAINPNKKAKTNRISEKQKALNREYKKQVDRIRRFIKRGELRGYHFMSTIPKRKTNRRTGESEVVVPTDIKMWELPKRPKKITEATIRKLKEITPEYLYNRALFIDPATSEILTGQEGRNRERKSSAKKAAETRKRNTIYTEKDNGIWGDSGDEDDELLGWSELPEPPIDQPYDYILDEVMQMLRSLSPSDDKYTKSGKLWSVDESRGTWSGALVKTFLRIQDEESTNGTMAEYCDYLVSVADKINEYVEVAKKSSRAESVAANCEAIVKLLNRGEALQPHEEDSIQRYVMGEIDEI